MNKSTIVVVVIVLIILGMYFLNLSLSSKVNVTNNEVVPNEVIDVTPITPPAEVVEEVPEIVNEKETVIGKSIEGNAITAYHYGEGTKEILFVGGIHGGYSWNTALVAYELMDYLERSPQAIPENVKVTVIPILNPDGLAKVVGTTGRFTVADVPTLKDETVPGRFNANNVDLNRNFDCDWQSVGKWQRTNVSGGKEVFSEPEARAIRDYVTKNAISGAVAWYSAAGGVFASNCHNGVAPETTDLTNLYAKASGYPPYKEFNFYEITGDMVNWFAKNDIPAISVLLTNHTDTEWSKNKAGIDALLKYYAE